MKEIKEVLKAVTGEIHPLGNAPMEQFASIWKPYEAARKTILTHKGEVEKHLYLIIDGVQRVYAFNEPDKESTLVFTYPPSFGGVIDSLMLQLPSRYYYETLSPSRFYKTSYKELFEVMNSHKEIEVLIRKGISGALSGVMDRLTELQSCSSEEKFRRLLNRSPHILQIIPHKYIANYLAIDPTNFSKLLNSIRI